MAEAGALARKPRRGDELECTVERFDERGGAIARAGPYRVELRHGLPGQVLRVRVLGRRRDRIRALPLEELRAAPNAVAPRCRHFASCGGCSFQDLAYDAQLVELRRGARALLEPLAVEGFEPDPVEGCREPFGYRNKMDFTFSNRRWIEADEPPDAPDGFALGLHVAGRFDKVLDVARCEIQFEEANGLLASVRELAVERALEPWDVRRHTGLLRHLVLRKAVTTGEILVDLVTSREERDAVDELGRALLARHPEITTLVQNVNTRPAAIAVGEWERVLHGPGAITERLAGLVFSISANSFFQTNTRQAERLLGVVREEAEPARGGVVYDVYCGTGLLTLALSGLAREVIGFERERSAVDDALRSARANGVENARFVCGDAVETTIPSELQRRGIPAPDLCVVDPPRAGLHAHVVDALRTLAPPRLVYVSCNLASAVRDLTPLVEDGYELVRARPLDLFPHTPHLECVLTLVRSGSPRP